MTTKKIIVWAAALVLSILTVGLLHYFMSPWVAQAVAPIVGIGFGAGALMLVGS